MEKKFLSSLLVLGVFSSMFSVNAQYLDISRLTAEKFPLVVENKTIIVYYGYAGGFEGEISDDDIKKSKIRSVDIDFDKKSLVIEIDEIIKTDFMWIRIPEEVLSAENNDFQILVNEVKREYDLVAYESDVRVGFLVQEGITKIEIIGTRVIPEFDSAIILLGGSIFLGIVITNRLRNKFKSF